MWRLKIIYFICHLTISLDMRSVLILNTIVFCKVDMKFNLHSIFLFRGRTIHRLSNCIKSYFQHNMLIYFILFHVYFVLSTNFDVCIWIYAAQFTFLNIYSDTCVAAGSLSSVNEEAKYVITHILRNYE